MGGTKFKAALRHVDALPEIRARNIDALHEAVPSGKVHKVKGEVDELVDRRFGEFTEKAKRRVVSRFVTTLPTAAKLTHKSDKKLDVSEASGVAPLSGGRMLVLDDRRGIYLVGKNGEASAIASGVDKNHSRYDVRLRDLEGIAVDEAEENIFVVSESSRRIFRIPIEHDDGKITAGRAESLGILPALNGGEINGWEGIAVLPGRFLGGGPDMLVVIHECEPTKIAIVDIPKRGGDDTLEFRYDFDIPRQARPHLTDVSDVAVHPKTGHLFLLSDRQQTIVELETKFDTQAQRGGLIRTITLELIGVTEIPGAKGTKPEGNGFDPDTGDVVVVAEKGKTSRVHRFEVS